MKSILVTSICTVGGMFMKAILIDDEPLALDFLEHQIKKVSHITIAGKFLYLDLNKESDLLNNVDIVFLDIEMPEMNGLELAELLVEKYPDMTIVFVTAYNEYAVEAFELNALDYIVKPVQLDRLKKTIGRIEKQINIPAESSSSDGHPLQIQVCRELAFVMNDQIEPLKWRTAKVQELFLYLLLNVGKTIRKDELSELLWPDFEIDRAHSQLYTAIYHIRKTLNPFRDHFSIKNMNEGYILMGNNIQIDMVEWEHKISSLPPIHSGNIDQYEDAMSLYTGSYLQEHAYAWIEPERYRLEQLWVKTVYQITDHYLQQDNLEYAEAWLVKICTLRPEEESAHFTLMKLYADIGYGMFVHQQFAQLRDALNELGVKISPKIKKWYQNWANN